MGSKTNYRTGNNAHTRIPKDQSYKRGDVVLTSRARNGISGRSSGPPPISILEKSMNRSSSGITLQ